MSSPLIKILIDIMKLKTALALIGILMISCVRELEIDVPFEDPKLVVYSTIVPFTLPMPKQLGITLKKSQHLSDTNRNSIVDALVLYYENNILIDTLQYGDSTGVYAISTSIANYPKAGYSYSIKIVKEGFETVTATTKIPQKVHISETAILPIAFINEDGSPFTELSIRFTDPADEINFYEIAIGTDAYEYENPESFYNLTTYDNIITSESYYPSLIRIGVRKPRQLLFSDKTINGQERTLKLYYKPPMFFEDGLHQTRPHFIHVHLRNITEDYYKFHTTKLHHLNNRQEDILYGTGEPLNLVSNVKNGLGLFAGFNNDIQTLFIPGQIINK